MVASLGWLRKACCYIKAALWVVDFREAEDISFSFVLRGTVLPPPPLRFFSEKTTSRSREPLQRGFHNNSQLERKHTVATHFESL